jgi:hypothetical protein
MTNQELYEEWARRYVERTKREREEKARKSAEEEKIKKEKPAQETQTTPKITLSKNLQYQFLQDDFGKEINEKIQEKYGTYPAINKISYNEKNKIVEGSNPFYVVAVQEFLPQNIRVATQADLERILKTNALPLEGYYEDSSLVWRSNKEPNEYLAQDIYKQFKDKGIELQNPSVIPLFTLKLREDESSPYKLAFDITDLTLENYFSAPILNSKSGSYINPAEINEKTGIPEKVYNKSVSGNRQLWTINSGLSRLYLGRVLDLDSYWDVLADSSEGGRVVVSRAKARCKKFRSEK